MHIESLKDMLGWTPGFHQSLANGLSGDKGLSGDERRLAEVVEEFEVSVEAYALKTSLGDGPPKDHRSSGARRHPAL